MNPPIAVTGIWSRTAGHGRERRLEVLVEIGGVWRFIQSHPAWSITDGEVSHITEPLGMKKAQPDYLTRKTKRGSR